MTKIESKVVAAWKKAAIDLGFQFTAPFIGKDSNGVQFEALGLVHQFGRRIGTLISVAGEPSADFEHPSDDNYTWSCLGRTSYTQYNRQAWVEMLDDWQFAGPENQRPKWYSGKPWA